jgi:hypothetical protein
MEDEETSLLDSPSRRTDSTSKYINIAKISSILIFLIVTIAINSKIVENESGSFVNFAQVYGSIISKQTSKNDGNIHTIKSFCYQYLNI